MTLTAAPVLETERLRLRGPETRDAEAVIAFLLDKERAELFGHYENRGNAWRWFALMVGHWHIHGYGYFIIADKNTDEAIGLCGIWNPEGWPEPEIGWVVFSGHEGKGIAFEAATCVRDYAYTDLGFETLTSNIVPGNTRSVKLAERMGAAYERTYQNIYMGEDMLYRHPPREDVLAEGGMEAYS